LYEKGEREMSSKVWRVSGEYTKKKRSFGFTKEILADTELHVKEKILSEIGSRHKVSRRYISFSEITEIKPEELTSLELRRKLGVESED
jgi:large subunit ribosomal protein LX